MWDFSSQTGILLLSSQRLLLEPTSESPSSKSYIVVSKITIIRIIVVFWKLKRCKSLLNISRQKPPCLTAWSLLKIPCCFSRVEAGQNDRKLNEKKMLLKCFFLLDSSSNIPRYLSSNLEKKTIGITENSKLGGYIVCLIIKYITGTK